MKIHHVQIMIPPGREAEATGFYAGLLGLDVVPKPPGAGRPGLWFSCGEQEIHLGIDDGAAEPRASRAHAAFEIDDFDAVRARITGADFEVRDAAPLSGRRRFHTRDPFGNRLEFLEPLPD
jgi:catechol 2,3-dioxygenase-like lactoylglutathione lyase family enzyme